MTSYCPHIHNPFARWRLQCLANLSAIGESQPLSRLGILHSHHSFLHYSTYHRRYSSKGSFQFTKPGNYGAQPAGGSETVTDASQDFRSTQPPRPRRRLKFDPYSDSHRKDLAKLVSELQDLTQEVQSDKGQKKFAIQDQDELQDAHSVLPDGKHEESRQSPIQIKFVSTDFRNTPKPRPSPEQTALVNDPWAKMLASPVRLCQASYARLPVRLLTNWKFMRDSEHNTYLMPSAIAGLDDTELDQGTIEWREQKREENRAMRVERYQQRLKIEAQAGKHETKVTVAPSTETHKQRPQQIPQPFTPSPAFPGHEPAVRITPYSNLLINITEQLSRPARSKAAAEGDREPMPGAIERIIPYRWRERIHAAQHLEKHREQVEAATGHKDFRPAPAEAQIDLKRVKWPENIESRMLEMLRCRVLSALQRMLQANSSKHAIKLRRVAAIPMPKGNETKALPELTEYVDEDTEDVLLESHGTEQQDSDPATRDYRPLATRYFIHMGESSLPTTFPFFAKSESLVPPLLTHPTTHQSFPIFPIRDMLGPEQYSELLKLVGQWPIIQPPNDQARVDSSDTATDWLILVRVRQAYTEVLLSELWRLWRYRGGRHMENISDAA